jgi:hypothetical protein
MKFFDASNGFQPSTDNTYEFSVYSYDTVKKMLDIMKFAEYSFPDFTAIKTNNLSEVIGEKLANYFKDFSIKELSELHRVCNFFICDGVRKLVAAAVACRFYFVPNYAGFTAKMVEMNIKTLPTIASIKVLREKIPGIID